MEPTGLVDESYWTITGTVTGYLAILLVITLVVFVLPYLIFLTV